jgi:hypothetical protein
MEFNNRTKDNTIKTLQTDPDGSKYVSSANIDKNLFIHPDNRISKPWPLETIESHSMMN